MSDEKSALGLSPSLTAALAYVLGFISGLIIFVLEKENRFVRFHAMQSILLSVSFFVLGIIAGCIPVIGPAVSIIVSLASLVCWLIGIVKAAQGEYFKFPWVGDYAEKQI